MTLLLALFISIALFSFVQWIVLIDLIWLFSLWFTLKNSSEANHLWILEKIRLTMVQCAFPIRMEQKYLSLHTATVAFSFFLRYARRYAVIFLLGQFDSCRLRLPQPRLIVSSFFPLHLPVCFDPIPISYRVNEELLSIVYVLPLQNRIFFEVFLSTLSVLVLWFQSAGPFNAHTRHMPDG